MNYVLELAIKLKHALVYLDDIIVYSADFDDHLGHLEHVFQLLTEAGLKIKPSKCEFVKQDLIYLGHIITLAPGGTGKQCI